MSRSLCSSEWTLVGSFLLLFASVVFISQANRQKDIGPPLPPHQKISVTISGAVSKPGTFSVLPGMTLEAILRKSRPNRFANLRDLDLERRVEDPLEVHLELLTEVAVRIEGAVEAPLALQLPVGTRVCDLKSKVAYTPDADVKFFRSRRMLWDGEVLEIPRVSL